MDVEDFEDTADVAALVGAGVEFAVGKSARAALAVAIVGILVEKVFEVEEGDVTFALLDALAALQYYRAQSKFDEPQRRKQPSRSHSNHHDRRLVGYVTVIVFGGDVFGVFTVNEQRHAHIDDNIPSPRIHRLVQYCVGSDTPHINARALGGLRQIIFTVGGVAGSKCQVCMYHLFLFTKKFSVTSNSGQTNHIIVRNFKPYQKHI